MKTLIGTFLVLLLLTGCSRPEQVQTLSGFAQGTTWHVSVWKAGGVDRQALEQNIEAEFARLDTLLSNYRPDSVIERFNADPAADGVTVGPEIVSLVHTARKVSEATEGCYDLTVRPLFELWGFTGDHLTIPDDATLQRTLDRTGFSGIEAVTPDRLRKVKPKLRVDVSSIAQGYSVARISEVVEASGIQNYIVEIGGELQTRGHKPGGAHWRIGVERPLPGGRKVQKALTIQRDAPIAVMTSGTYRHYFDSEGKRYSHVLDARTGRPVTHHTVSVTVLNDDPTVADAWSTALLCLGQEAGTEVADAHDIAALFISDDNGRLDESATTAWQSMGDVDVK